MIFHLNVSKLLHRAQRELAILQEQFPKELDCADYKSFLTHAPLIPHYPFKEEALLQLVDLAYNCYTSGKRYNKRLLFDTLRRYCQKYEGTFHFPEEKKQQLFEIFSSEVCTPGPIRYSTSHLLAGQKLTDKQIRRLIELAFDSEEFLNRLLRYPEKNELISNWAKYYYEDDRLRNRRLELTSKVLDIEPDFIPSEQVLYDDQAFLYEDKEDDFAFNTIYNGKMQPVFKHLESDKFEMSKANADTLVDGTVKRWAKLKEDYSNNTLDKNELNAFVKQALRRTAYIVNHRREVEPLVLHRSRIMIWAVVYSHMEELKKIELVSQFYHPELANTIIYVAKKKKFEALLKWLIKILKD